MPSPARTAALDQLDRIVEAGAYVGFFTEAELDVLESRERRQATDLVAGVTRWRRWLDFLLASYYRGDFASMEEPLKQVLRVGLYELLFTATPPHAAINEAVELGKQRVRRGAGGLVNGILRSIERQRDDLPQPQTGDRADDLAVRHSHPTWMVRRWLARYGEEETIQLLKWNNARPGHSLRLDTERLTVEAFGERLADQGISWRASPYADDFVRLQGLQAVLEEEWLDEGVVAVQDEAAGLVVRLVDPQPGETVVDLCAAPGGKTIYLALRMTDWGTLHAYDVHEGRLRLVEEAARRHGVRVVETHAADGRTVPDHDEAPVADRVLVDAPCTGLGVLAKRADLRWRRSPEDLAELATLQDELLDAAARLVRPGGLVVYSTCSIAPEENEQRVDAFLERHPDFEAEPAHHFVPDELVDAHGYYQALPHRHGIDGAFGVRLRRRDA